MPESDFAKALSPINIEDEMRQSYMEYAMSVIVGRALPDVRPPRRGHRQLGQDEQVRRLCADGRSGDLRQNRRIVDRGPSL